MSVGWLLRWIVLIIVLLWVINNPVRAANLIHQIWDAFDTLSCGNGPAPGGRGCG